MWHVLGEKINAYKFLWKYLKERKHLEVKHLYDRIVLRRILKELHWREWTGLIRLRMGTNGGLL
jgi:hypothetical protein